MDKELCCDPATSLPKYDFEGPSQGTVSKIGEIDVYTVGSSPKVFIFLSDIYGFDGGRERQVCDQIASLGYTVVYPDVLKGDGWYDPLGSQFYEWLASKKYEPMGDYLLKTLIPNLSSSGKTAFAIGGACFGAWVGFKTLASSSELKCGISYHPAFIVEELQGGKIEDVAMKVKQPHLLIQTGSDPTNVKPGELVKILEKSNGNRVEVCEMGDVKNDFLLQGNLKDETLRKRVEQAVTLTGEFLAKYL